MAKQHDRLQIETKCSMCKKVHIIDVPKEGYMQWINGTVRIQDVMPDVSIDDRELLISGICGPCFDGLFAEDED